MGVEKATFGGGCFWCLEGAFQRVKGVLKVESGYTGGHMEAPSYDAVCTGQTGHAEVVQLQFDPDVIEYVDLLALFFDLHDPTTLNRQGADVGSQYRSAIFYHSDIQAEAAKAYIKQLTEEGRWPDPVVTQIDAIGVFYKAEDYHQNYFVENPANRYCQMVVAPKLKKFLDHHSDKVHK